MNDIIIGGACALAAVGNVVTAAIGVHAVAADLIDSWRHGSRASWRDNSNVALLTAMVGVSAYACAAVAWERLL